MSAEPTAAPSQEEARQVLLGEAFVPGFFSKLAELGVQPATQDHADSLLRMGFRMLEAEAAGGVKEASAGDDFLAEAERGLDMAMRQYGLAPDRRELLVMKQAAEQVVANPALRAAALALAAS